MADTAPKHATHCLTIRISDIPIEKTCDDLQNDLQSLSVIAPAVKDTLDSAENFTLAQLRSDTACATVTVYSSYQDTELLGLLHRATKQQRLPYRFDASFYGITPLCDTTSPDAVDIVAVPGLASHPIGSWRGSTYDLWLRDYLPKDLPNIRVILYGYNTKLTYIDSKPSFDSLGRSFLEQLEAFRVATKTNNRPLVFIGSSLGGILIKEALIFCHAKQHQSHKHEIYKATIGLMFFGVPNHGLRNNQLLSIVRGRNQSLIRDLVVDEDAEPSPFLKRISDQFSICFKQKFRVISLYEKVASPTAVEDINGEIQLTGPSQILVTEASATGIGLTAESDSTNVPLDTDHSGLVKYSSRSDGSYTIVVHHLIQLLQATMRSSREIIEASTSLVPYQSIPETATTIKDQGDHSKSHFIVPFGRNAQILGREAELRQLLDKIPAKSRQR